MKKIFFLFSLALLPVCFVAQNISNIDYVSPFHDGLAAVKQGDNWGFIDTEGAMVVGFRGDLITTKVNQSDYPVFKNNRCLIIQIIDGISYFGYINNLGETVIAPEFLNAANFVEDYAIALKLDKVKVGRNDMLDVDVFRYRYYEVLIDDKGDIMTYLFPDNDVPIALDKTKLRNPPEISLKLISNNVLLKQQKNGKWTLIKLN